MLHGENRRIIVGCLAVAGLAFSMLGALKTIFVFTGNDNQFYYYIFICILVFLICASIFSRMLHGENRRRIVRCLAGLVAFLGALTTIFVFTGNDNQFYYYIFILGFLICASILFRTSRTFRFLSKHAVHKIWKWLSGITTWIQTRHYGLVAFLGALTTIFVFTGNDNQFYYYIFICILVFLICASILSRMLHGENRRIIVGCLAGAGLAVSIFGALTKIFFFPGNINQFYYYIVIYILGFFICERWKWLSGITTWIQTRYYSFRKYSPAAPAVHIYLPMIDSEEKVLGNAMLQLAGFFCAEDQHKAGAAKIKYHDHRYGYVGKKICSTEAEIKQFIEVDLGVKDIVENHPSSQPLILVFTMSRVANIVRKYFSQENANEYGLKKIKKYLTIVFTVASNSPSENENEEDSYWLSGKAFFYNFISINEESQYLADRIADHVQQQGESKTTIYHADNYGKNMVANIKNDYGKGEDLPFNSIPIAIKDCPDIEVDKLKEEMRKDHLFCILIAHGLLLRTTLRNLIEAWGCVAKESGNRLRILCTATLSVPNWKKEIQGELDKLTGVDRKNISISFLELSQGYKDGSPNFTEYTTAVKDYNATKIKEVINTRIQSTDQNCDLVKYLKDPDPDNTQDNPDNTQDNPAKSLQDEYKEMEPNYISAFCYDTLSMIFSFIKHRRINQQTFYQRPEFLRKWAGESMLPVEFSHQGQVISQNLILKEIRPSNSKKEEEKT